MAKFANTDAGGIRREFPSTQWTVIRQAKDRESPAFRQALESLCQLYWKPIYAYICSARRLGNEEAKDLTQEFLLDVVEGDLLTRYAPTVGSFRAYVQGALRLFLLEFHRNATTQKKGGGRKLIALDDEVFQQVEATVTSGTSPEEVLDRQWAQTVIAYAAEDLKKELVSAGKEILFQLFQRRDLKPPPEGPPSYSTLAGEFKLKETDVTNYLWQCRQRLRELVQRRIREYVGDDADLASEWTGLFSEK